MQVPKFSLQNSHVGVFNALICALSADELINNGNPFTIGWHATTFPVVGLCSSTLDFYHFRHYNTENDNVIIKIVALLAVWLASCYVLGVWIATIVQILRKKMFVEAPKKSSLLVQRSVSSYLMKTV